MPSRQCQRLSIHIVGIIFNIDVIFLQLLIFSKLSVCIFSYIRPSNSAQAPVKSNSQPIVNVVSIVDITNNVYTT